MDPQLQRKRRRGGEKGKEGMGMRAREAEGGPKCINIVRAAHDNPDCCAASGTFGRQNS